MKKQKHLTALLLLLCVMCTAFAQQTGGTLIKGQVIDPNGEPIIGANVLVEGTTHGVITDLDGYYQLNVKTGCLQDKTQHGLEFPDFRSEKIQYPPAPILKGKFPLKTYTGL